jgi:hypothetical protein
VACCCRAGAAAAAFGARGAALCPGGCGCGCTGAARARRCITALGGLLAAQLRSSCFASGDCTRHHSTQVEPSTCGGCADELHFDGSTGVAALATGTASTGLNRHGLALAQPCLALLTPTMAPTGTHQPLAWHIQPHMCSAPPGQQPPEHRVSAAGRPSAPPVRLPRQWACPCCTLLNTSSEPQCGACDNPAPAAAGRALPTAAAAPAAGRSLAAAAAAGAHLPSVARAALRQTGPSEGGLQCWRGACALTEWRTGGLCWGSTPMCWRADVLTATGVVLWPAREARQACRMLCCQVQL